MFGTEDRDRLRQRVLEMARADQRVVAAAEVGSLAAGDGDRWSDLDLTFGVDDAVEVASVLADWTSAFVDELGAVELFDLVAGATVYRVFMFRDCLQLDVSLTPASSFGPTSPRFNLLFGEAVASRASDAPPARHYLGWAVMWARHARVCIERGRLRQAEHALFRMRESALDYACARRGLPAGYGRGLEQLPPEVHHAFSLSGLDHAGSDPLEEGLRSSVAALRNECDQDEDGKRVVGERLAETVRDL